MNIFNVVIFTPRPEFKMLIEIECRAFSGDNFKIFSDVEEFQSLIQSSNSIDIVVVDAPDDADVFSLLTSEIQNKSQQLKEIFLITNQIVPINKVKHFAKNALEEMLHDLRMLLHASNATDDGYISVPMETLIHFKLLPCDLYIKVGENKYFKRIPANEEIDAPTFTSFVQRGITELYFERKNNRDFSFMLINNMINKVQQDYVKIDEKLVATNNVLLTTQQIIAKLGFKPKLIEVCDSVINQIISDVGGGQENFQKFLLELRKQKELSFQYRLIELTSFIGTQMIELIEQPRHHEYKIKRLVFASMFCDVSLTNPDQIHYRRADQVASLKSFEKKLVSEHAFLSSEMIRNYSNAPWEAIEIIKQHHGSLKGNEFPAKISEDLDPMAKCLMAAQEIAYDILIHSEMHPTATFENVKMKYVGTPLELYMEKFKKCCRPQT